MRPKKELCQLYKGFRLNEPPHQFSLSLCTVVWKAITEPFLSFAGRNTEAQGTNCNERRRLFWNRSSVKNEVKWADLSEEVVVYKNSELTTEILNLRVSPMFRLACHFLNGLMKIFNLSSYQWLSTEAWTWVLFSEFCPSFLSLIIMFCC